jgi:hypothetical protein
MNHKHGTAEAGVTIKRGGVTMTRGVVYDDDLQNVVPDLWPELIGEYRRFCKRTLPNPTASLVLLNRRLIPSVKMIDSPSLMADEARP